MTLERQQEITHRDLDLPLVEGGCLEVYPRNTQRRYRQQEQQERKPFSPIAIQQTKRGVHPRVSKRSWEVNIC